MSKYTSTSCLLLKKIRWRPFKITFRINSYSHKNFSDKSEDVRNVSGTFNGIYNIGIFRALVNFYQPLTTIAKKLRLRCLTRLNMRLCTIIIYKVFKDGQSFKNWRDMVCLSRPYSFKFFKSCLLQINLVHSWILCSISSSMIYCY